MTKRLADKPQPNLVVVLRPFEDPVPEHAPQARSHHARQQLSRHHLSSRRPRQDEPAAVRGVEVRRKPRRGRSLGQGRRGHYLGKTLHRIDEAIVIAEMRKAGFVLEAEGDSCAIRRHARDFLRRRQDPDRQVRACGSSSLAAPARRPGDSVRHSVNRDRGRASPSPAGCSSPNSSTSIVSTSFSTKNDAAADCRDLRIRIAMTTPVSRAAGCVPRKRRG